MSPSTRSIPVSPLEPPVGAPPRWTDTALPDYRHVPGLTPHPIKSPQGHSHGGMQLDLGRHIDDFAHRWVDCPAYLVGVDLFNQGFYWESHEAWEEIWNAVGHRSPPGRMLQGMIQVAAALLRQHMGSERGAQGNFSKALVHFDAVAAELSRERSWDGVFLGVTLMSWSQSVAEYLVDSSIRRPFLQLQLPLAAH